MLPDVDLWFETGQEARCCWVQIKPVRGTKEVCGEVKSVVEPMSQTRLTSALAWLAALALVAGCGAAAAPGAPPGSPTPRPSASPTPVSTDIPASARGSVCKDGAAFPQRTAVGSGWISRLEGCPQPWILRVFLSFPLSQIPEGATIHSAELLARRHQTGTPYAVRGQRLLLEAVPWRDTSGGIDPGDFDADVLEGTRTVVAASADGEELHVDVTELARIFHEAQKESADFRLRFSLEPAPPGTSDQVEEILSPVVRIVYTP